MVTLMMLWAIGDSHKVNPISGNVLEEHTWHQIDGRGDPYFARPSYQGRCSGKLRMKSAVWDSQEKRISLRGASNEFVAFQVIVARGSQPLKGVCVKVTDLTGPGGTIKARENIDVFVEWYLNVASQAEDSWDHKTYFGPRYWYPDALIPCTLDGWGKVGVPDERLAVPDQTHQGFWVDVYVPHGTQPGAYRGKVTVTASGVERQDLALQLQVLPWELPDELSVICELNTYHSSFAAQPHFDAVLGSEKHYRIEEAFYKMGHQHRCTLNVFPGWASTTEKTPEQCVEEHMVPKIAGEGKDIHVVDWTAWDNRYGRYFTGEAFRDCPRRGQPLTHFYMPFSLGWPSRFSQYYDDREKYETEFTTILRQFDRHIRERGWNRTQFQYFFNGKRKFGEPWNTDEPTVKDEYDALRYYGKLLNDTVGTREKRKSRICYRVDIGTYLTTRDQLDGVVDLRVVNYEVNPSAFWGRLMPNRDACLKAGEQWWYYAQDHGRQRQTRIDWGLTSAILWGWAAWDLKVQGICHWQCMGWNPADPLRLPGIGFHYVCQWYPGKEFGHDGPLASMRLKGWRRGLQDYEHLAILTRLNEGNSAQADAIMKRYYNLTRARPGDIRVEAEDTYRMRYEAFSAILEAQAKHTESPG
jgi:hypothetical protein